MSDAVLDALQTLRSYGGEPATTGLDDARIRRFSHDPALQQAAARAVEAHRALCDGGFADVLAGSEADAIRALQSRLVNFYAPEAINPYVALTAQGPWIVTAWGAVLHDSGGYGMLGFGHAPPGVIEAMSPPWVMANVMTPSFSQPRLTNRLDQELGHTRADGNPFARYLCLNSGSEAVTVAARISDIHCKQLCGPGGRYEGRPHRFLSLTGSFHGRTDRPAQFSASTLPTYRKHLASFSGRDNLATVPPNDIDALRSAFESAERDGVFIEMMLMEPVQGEGNPGQPLSRAFYDEARRLTREHGSLLLIDSIQAGLRAHGVLSIVDYPGFQDCDPPDLETWSKALNAGQYPLSVLGMSKATAELYAVGVYGNTMTTNPRALEVACSVLDSLTPELRRNITERGAELVAGLEGLRAEMPELVTRVQGTGLLVSAHLTPELEVVGFGGVEEWLRRHGLGVIHGGKNALRFTPHFAITSEEVTLMVDLCRDALRALAPR